MGRYFIATVVIPLIFLGRVTTIPAAFISTPTSVNATLGYTTTFNCSATTGTIVWLVNGSLLTELNALDIRATSIGGAFTLHIPATEEYNNTVVECEVVIRDPILRIETSDPAVLKVQGLLDAVSNFKSESLGKVIHLTWDAPFSLDITGVDPDIWYRIEFTVNGTHSLGKYSKIVNIPEFNFTMGDHNHTNTSVIYKFRVTPINGAGNGIASAPVTGYFGELPRSIAAQMVEMEVSVNPLNVNFIITYETIPPGEMPDRFQVYAETIDGGNKVFYCTDDIFMAPDSNGTVFIQLNTSTPTCMHSSLQSHRKYKAIITGKNEVGTSNSTGDILFSTHEVQNCAVNYSKTRTVNINCTFAGNSKAKGYLSILCSKTNSFQKIYVVANREDTSSSNLDINISGTPLDEYNMVVFDLGRNGLPPVLSGDINYILAAEEENITVTTSGYTEVDDVASVNGIFLEVPDIISAELILCIFFESSSKVNGTVLLAQHIDDPEKLLVFFPDSTNCAMAPPPGGYSLGVFAQSSECSLEEPATPLTISVHIVPIISPMPSAVPTTTSAVPTTTNNAPLSLVVVAVPVAVFTLLVTVTVVTAVIIICLRTMAKKDKREIGMKPNPAYETVTKLNPSKSARQIATKPCPAYEGVALALH